MKLPWKKDVKRVIKMDYFDYEVIKAAVLGFYNDCAAQGKPTEDLAALLEKLYKAKAVKR